MFYDVKTCSCGHSEYFHFKPSKFVTKRTCKHISCRCVDFKEDAELENKKRN